VSADSSAVLVDGPWRHRFVAANGARFHVAEQGEGPLVVLLHGFPEFWWCWRHQLPALAAAGYRVAALDLRGYGASDKPPRGYDTPTLVADVAGVVRSLGEPDAVVVGHDWGAHIAWSMPALAPRVTRAVAAVSAAHPLRTRSAVRHPRQLRASWYVAAAQLPVLPERLLRRGDVVVRALVAGSRTPGWPDAESARRYREAMLVPFAPHSSLEYYRWLVRSVPRTDGRRYVAAMRAPIAVPVLQVHGGADPLILPRSAFGSQRWVVGSYRAQMLAGVGHFVPEEAPEELSSLLLDWLATLDRPRR
jgi:pimeloyl-ACP methyl ester carboxylesterase